MKRITKVLMTALTATMVFSLASCGSGQTKKSTEIIIDNNEKSTFALNVSSLELSVGDTFALSPRSYMSKEGLTWYSSAKKIVSVDSNGHIEALEQGSAVISAYDSLSVGSISVTVTAPDNKLSISLSVNQIAIGIGDDYSYRVKATVLVDGVADENASVGVVKKEESSLDVATCLKSGEYYKVTGLKEGTAVFSFTASGDKGTVGKNLYVTVKNAE